MKKTSDKISVNFIPPEQINFNLKSLKRSFLYQLQFLIIISV